MDGVKPFEGVEARCSIIDAPTSSPPPSSSPARWRPSLLVFKPYSPSHGSRSRVDVQRPAVARLTHGIIETYQTCNPRFRYADDLNPKRFLTSPSDGVLNDGHDNLNSDLILTVNHVLVNTAGQRYIVKDLLGHGTFGQVVKCWAPESNSYVAVKIIKNQAAYYQQALVEVAILTTLNRKLDPEDKHHIVRVFDHFVFQHHLCISFELLDANLYELIKMNDFRGLSLSIVQLFSKQLLCGLALLKEASIIHCDLKPENILLCTRVKPAEVKIIDFGSACMEDKTVYSYIQSRYYRSPEVLLGYQYTTAIDMWSFGCIVAELFLGYPLFPGASEFDLLKRMIRILGGQPPDYLLREAKNTSKFFKYVGAVDHMISEESCYQALTEEEYEAREKKKPVIGKEYFNYLDLEGIVSAIPFKKSLSEEDRVKEEQIRFALIDFLKGLVEFDPAKRWSPFQASKHPFLTGEPFTCPYVPPPETARVPVRQNSRVMDHHPGGGHWFAAGLSPNIPGRNVTMHAMNPYVQNAPYATHGSSYGSLGSHGSYSDCTGLVSSYGSYGDNHSTFPYLSPAAMNMHTQGGGGGMMPMIGMSPDSRGWMIQHHHRSRGLGISPSAGGSFAPLPLGTSPSQFTPPNSSSSNLHQASVAGSPGIHYGGGSSSQGSRGCTQGSPLGKGFAASHFTTGRKNWRYSQEVPPTSSSSTIATSQWQGQYADGYDNSFPPESSNSSHGPYPHTTPHLSANTYATSAYKQQPRPQVAIGAQFHHSTMSSSTHMHSATKVAGNNFVDLPEVGSPDPGDWDPNYSDDLLLQEGGLDESFITSQFNSGLRIVEPSLSVHAFSGLGRGNHNQSANHRSVLRPDAFVNASSQGQFAYQPGYSNSVPVSHSQNSRLGHLPIQHEQLGAAYGISSSIPVVRDRDGFQMKFQQGPFSYNSAGPRSRGGGSLGNAASWGRRTSYIPGIPPAHGRKDYNRIA